MEGLKQVDGIVTMKYTPFERNGVVGFRCVASTGVTSYIYLNPSSTDDGSDKPNVFLYQGWEGSPELDEAQHHYLIPVHPDDVPES